MDIKDWLKKKKANIKEALNICSDFDNQYEQNKELWNKVKDQEQKIRELEIEMILRSKKIILENKILHNNHKLSAFEKALIIRVWEEIIDLISDLRKMSDEEIKQFEEKLWTEGKLLSGITLQEFKQNTQEKEKVIMDMIYDEHSDPINQILYGSNEKGPIIKKIR